MDKTLLAIAKGVLYAFSIVLVIAVLFRGILPVLWGSGTALGLIGAGFVTILGLLIILFIISKMYKDFKSST